MATDSLWSNIANLIETAVGGGSMGPHAVPYTWGGGGSDGGGGGWGGIASEIFRSAVPGIAKGIGLAVPALAAEALFPGTRGSVRSFDTRTPEARTATQQMHGRLTSGLSDPSLLVLPPEEQERRKAEAIRQFRSSRAASGMLETGHTATGESEMLRKLQGGWAETGLRDINTGFANIMGQQEQLKEIPGRKNPWAEIITGALSPALGEGLEAGARRAFKIPKPEQRLKWGV